jgi:hypothetical protein
LELPNRSELETAFAKRVARLNQRHKAELRRLLGYPPDPSRVPESFWREVEREQQEELVAMLYLIFLASSLYHGFGSLSPSAVPRERAAHLESASRSYGADRSATVAASYAQTSRNRFDTLGRKIEQAQERGEPLSRADLETSLESIFGAERAEGLAVSETTGAQSMGGESGIAATFGLSPADIWVTHPELTKTGPCRICKPLHGLPRSVWGITFPDGPGPSVHPGCACTIHYANRPGAVAA